MACNWKLLVAVVFLGSAFLPAALDTGAVHGRSGNTGPDLSEGSFFEDFNYSSTDELASAGWNASGLPVIATGTSMFLDDDGISGSLLERSLSADASDYAIEMKGRWIGRAYGSIRLPSVSGPDNASWSASADGQYLDYRFNDSGSISSYGGYTPGLDAWHVLKVVKSGRAFSFYDNGSLIFNHSSGMEHPGISAIGLRSGWTSSIEVDWIRISWSVINAQPDSLDLSADEAIYEPGDEVKLNAVMSGRQGDDFRLDWCRTVNGTPGDSPRIMNDGKYLYVLGQKQQAGGDRDVLLTKLDRTGTEVWNRTWGGPVTEYPLDLIIYDDTIYVVGNIGDGIYPDPMFLLAYNETGEELWNKTWGGLAMDWGTGLVGVDDALYITGWTTSYAAGNVDVLLVKYNLTSKSFEWYKTWGNAGDDMGEDITYLNKSFYVSVWASNYPGNAGVIKFDLDGNQMWNRTWGSGGSASSIASDGERIFVAGSRKDGSSHAGFLRFYNESGDLELEKLYGDPGYGDYFTRVRVSNGVAYCAGYTQSYSVNHSIDACLVGYDIASGAELLNFTWGGMDEDKGSGLTIMGDADIYCSGGTKSLGPGTPELFVFKYTNGSRFAEIASGINVKEPSGRQYVDMSNPTNSTGTATSSFTLPLDAPEGFYNCTATAAISGKTLSASTTFRVAWPWSSVLNLNSSLSSKSFLPGDFIELSSYAGYEYLPALAHRPSMGTNITANLHAPNGSILMTFTNVTGPDGWAGLDFTVPKASPAGTHTIQVRGFEGLGREIQFDVMVPVKQAPLKKEEPAYIPVEPLAGTVAIGLIAIGVSVAATETGKFSLFVPLAPLFTRIRRDKALDHRMRHQILGHLMENPGQHYNALKKALKTSNSVMVYHLLVLEREGFIKAQRDGVMKRFYLSSVKVPDRPQRTPDEMDSDIIAAIGKRPGINQKELVERLVMSTDVVGYHLRKLVREGKIVREKKGRTRAYHPVKK